VNLERLKLTNFKNHLSADFKFIDKVNCIIGDNGIGKTNVLDAIYYLAFTKSSLTSIDKNSINHDSNTAIIFGQFDNCSVGLQIDRHQRKVIKVDQVELEKSSDHIGNIPLVMVLPDDTELIKEGSEERRRFFDGALCQFDSSYLNDLIKYNRILKQRNSLLKQSNGQLNFTLLDSYDENLGPLAKSISTKRKAIVKEFEPFLRSNYQEIHDGKEIPAMEFKSHVTESFEKELRNSQERDIIMKRTMVGSHKDDIIFYLNNEPIKKFGSQGQQKTFIISLKFALYDFLKAKKEIKPLLLLDDIFDKLDDSRIKLLNKLIGNDDRFGQVFITDARKDRSKTLLSTGGFKTNFIEIG